MIKRVTKDDVKVFTQLAVLLWDTHEFSDLENELTEVVKSDNSCCLIEYDNENPIGFAQCQLRHDYVEGTDSSPVGYLEGIFVKEEYRHKGIAKELLNECEKWAKDKGCIEFASDCELGNITSLKFHLAMGFAEANRVICFSKKI